jgi:hypothetical protein
VSRDALRPCAEEAKARVWKNKQNEREQTMSNTMNMSAGVAGRLLLAYLLVLSQSVWAGPSPKPEDNAKPSQKAVAQQASGAQSPVAANAKLQTEAIQGEGSEKAVGEGNPKGDGKRESIKVHGHWTIEVRNPDGAMVRHVEFENSLTLGGATSLATLLLGTEVQGGFAVFLSNNIAGTTGPCSPGAGGATACILFASLINPTPAAFTDETNGCPGGADCFPLTIASNATLTGISLTGTAIAGSNGQITDVSVANLTCGPYPTTATSPINTASPSSCAAGTVSNIYGLTHATLSGPVQVLTGQSISVNVVISFS